VFVLAGSAAVAAGIVYTLVGMIVCADDLLLLCSVLAPIVSSMTAA
jgi:hypothetical protein